MARPFSKAGLYGNYIPGSTRRLRASAAGRSLPLYLRSTRPGIEAHYHDGVANDASGASYPSRGIASDYPWVAPLNATIPLGDGLSTRGGNRITMKKLQINMESHIRAHSIPSGHTVRVLLVFQKQTYGSAVSPSEILDAPIASSYYLAHQNTSFRDKYSILYDQSHVLNGSLSSTDNDPAATSRKVQHLEIDLGNRTASWAHGTANTLAGMTYGILYLMICNSGWTATDMSADTSLSNPSLAIRTRLIYEP